MTKGIIELAANRDFYFNGFLNFLPGNGKAAEGKSAPSFDEAIQDLQGKISAGTIQARDLKLRLDGPIERVPEYLGPAKMWGEKGDSDVATVKISPTSYYEWKEDYNRTPEESQRLQQLGLEQHNDRGYHFSRGLGVDVLPLTLDQKVVVSVRRSTDYDGEIHGVAGWLTFTPDAHSLKPIQDAYNELRQEVNVVPEDVDQIDLMGIVAYPHTLETDIIYLARLTAAKPIEYFTSGTWKEAVDAKEHRELVVLSNPDEIERLLQEGHPPTDSRKFKVLPSTHYGLEVLASCWDKLKPGS